jgi:hypothetical protein
MKGGKVDWNARGAAYEECAGHLELDWTDDPAEKQEGLRLSELLTTLAEGCYARAATRERKGAK